MFIDFELHRITYARFLVGSLPHIEYLYDHFLEEFSFAQNLTFREEFTGFWPNL